jgi:phage baseplate assembly protein W
MKRILHPSLTLGARKPYLSQRNSTLSRLDMVMHTHVGGLPWRPNFGCDLTGLVGEPATPSRINEARTAVSSAISRWLPEANVNECQIQLVANEGSSATYREVGIPVAESALVSMGTEARLELKIDLEIEDELIEIGTELDV